MYLRFLTIMVLHQKSQHIQFFEDSLGLGHIQICVFASLIVYSTHKKVPKQRLTENPESVRCDREAVEVMVFHTVRHQHPLIVTNEIVTKGTVAGFSDSSHIYQVTTDLCTDAVQIVVDCNRLNFPGLRNPNHLTLCHTISLR